MPLFITKSALLRSDGDFNKNRTGEIELEELWISIEQNFGDYAAILAAGPIPEDQLRRIEEFAEFNLPDEYRQFLARYGGAIVGAYEIAGYGQSEAMSNDTRSAIELTERFRADNWPGTEDALVISLDGFGNPICITKTGAVTSFDHDVGEFMLLGDSFASFITEFCLAEGSGSMQILGA